jgi:hypothetical protein
VSDEPAGSEHDHLRAVAGGWATSGHAVGSDVDVVGPGGWLLVHHGGVAVGTEQVRAIEVIGEPWPRAGAPTPDDDRTPGRCRRRWG